MHSQSKRSASKILVLGSLGFLVIAFLWPFASRSSRNSQVVQQDTYNVQVTQTTWAADGLDLQAVGQLVKTAKDGEDLEKLVNTPNINNLDLDADGNVDYIKVEEYGSGDEHGFSLYTELAEGEEQEIATIDVAKSSSEEYEVEIRGNQHIYGGGHYYHSRFGIGDALLVGWLFSSHRPYYSPWGYGHYPGYYRPYVQVPTSRYRERTGSSTRSSSFNRNSESQLSHKAQSPKSAKNSSKVRAPLKNPTASQKSFQARTATKPTGKGGFGRRSSTSSSSEKTTRRSSSTVRRSGSRRSGGRSGGK